MSKMNSLNETSNKLKKAINQEKKHVEALDLIQKMIEVKIGDPDRLAYIKVRLENGSTLYESDKQYLEDKSNQLQQLVDNQRKAELALQALNKLYESELRDSERLNAIKKALQEGRQVAQSEINFLNTKYEKLQQETDYQNRVEWTIGVIKRLHEAEIGNYERLEAIKTALEEKRDVDQSEISYIKEKYEQLLVIKKSKQTSDKNNTENIEQENTDTIMDLKTKISELEKTKTNVIRLILKGS